MCILYSKKNLYYFFSLETFAHVTNGQYICIVVYDFVKCSVDVVYNNKSFVCSGIRVEREGGGESICV